LETALDVNILLRELTPFEQLVCEHLCDGLTNSAIAKTTAHTEKVIENTVSRVAHAFSIKSNGSPVIAACAMLASSA
jgi:DNA-binding NarL/FixJ family response regulator